MGLQGHFDRVMGETEILADWEYHWEGNKVVFDVYISPEWAEELERLLLANEFNPVFDTRPAPKYNEPFGGIGFAIMGDEVIRARNVPGGDFKRDFNVSEYRRDARPARPDEEEMFEMRAAFGPGVEVVNVITGRKVIT